MQRLYLVCEGSNMLRVLFRASLLVIAFLIALTLLKFLFVKVLFFGLWLGAVAAVAFIVYSLVKRA
jgi:hypothetical protein